MKHLKINDLLGDYDCVSLYSSAIWDENRVYHRIETGHAYSKI